MRELRRLAFRPGAAVAAVAIVVAIATGAGAESASAPWALPAEGPCSPTRGLLRPEAIDPPAPPFETGQVFTLDRLAQLLDYLPAFIRAERERFFYEGMRLEIGPCFRDYEPPAFFQDATKQFRGSAQLGADGALEGYTAGLPFAPEGIDPADPEAGQRWLWNSALRYEAAGFRGKFRMTDLVGRTGRAEPFEGEIFKLRLSHRSDRPGEGYAVPEAKGNQWVAGGLFYRPFDAREYAWRQFRSTEQLAKAERSDDLHAYLPQWRRVRRIPATNVEGLYMPSFSVGVVPSQQLVVGQGGGGAGVAAGGGISGVGSTIKAKRSGYEGLEMRPVLWKARVIGLHDVLAPINAVTPVYPEQGDRDFGPYGLSFASDRWDLRRALVLEARSRAPSGAGDKARMILYLDLQTLQPLYMASFDRRDELTDVGLFVGRWSEDRAGYPRWPDDPERPVRVIDSVAAAFANLAESGSWRRESWAQVGTPPTDQQVRRMISVSQLTKRH